LPEQTLEQMSGLIGVMPEHVSQLEVAALAKLRRAFNKRLRPIVPEFLAAS
jgi:DNA-directed RNA polymerase sigma subunit (sigma70/sigma32)